MPSPKVKICGITRLEDAQAAIDFGADLLGFNFYPSSPRYIEPEKCARIISQLETQSRLPIVTVGVFVDSTPENVLAILDGCGLNLAQLCGDEPPETLKALGLRAFKAIRPANIEAVDTAIRNYPPRSTAPTWLIDAAIPGHFGGTGHEADWKLARLLAQQSPIMLAGGLRLENVVSALKYVQPWGVDVASGVESAPGYKDLAKMDAFIRMVHEYVQETKYVET